MPSSTCVPVSTATYLFLPEKKALFFLNERMWTKINWGKEYEPEYYL